MAAKKDGIKRSYKEGRKHKETMKGMNDMRLIEETKERTVVSFENEEGKVILTRCPIFPGVDILYIDAHIECFSFCAPPVPHVFAINHCEEGRVECQFNNGEYLYMGHGDMSISWRDHHEYCHTAFFPSAFYRGLSMKISVPQAEPCIRQLLGEPQFDLGALCNRFCKNAAFGMIMEATPNMEHLFYELYHVPESIHLRYSRLKVLEVLLFLGTLDTEFEEKRIYLTKSQVDIVKAVHNSLTKNMQQHVTIDDLAKKYGIAPTTLKRCFKSVYGSTIGQYIKDFRIAIAKRLLETTDASILAIANQVGYENSSKFSVAFKKVTGALPKDYRKNFQQ